MPAQDNDSATYKVIELVGTSPTSSDEAIQNAISRAAETVRNLDWFEVREVRGHLRDGAIAWYQVKLGVGFRLDDGDQAGA